MQQREVGLLTRNYTWTSRGRTELALSRLTTPCNCTCYMEVVNKLNQIIILNQRLNNALKLENYSKVSRYTGNVNFT